MKKLLLLIALMAAIIGLSAQITGYTFSEGVGTYTPLATYSVSTAGGDDGSQLLTLPFSFTYNETPYSTLGVCMNGFAMFGATNGTWTNALESTSVRPIVAPLWDDHYYDTATQIRYETLGTAPNRVFVVEWYGSLWYYSTGTPQYFQLHLYETSNNIKFSYNLQTPGGTPTASIGINALPGGAGNYLSVTPGSPSSVSSTVPNNSINSIANLPAGKWYQFNPPVAGTPPNPANAIYPAPGATWVPTNASLIWSSGGGMPTGYDLYFGTSNPPDFVGDLGNVTSWTPPAALNTGTDYYWQVIPYNANGDATGCPVWSFETMPPGLVQIGTGTDLVYLPINAYYGYSYSQTYYLAGEIGQAGLISNISYYWNGAAANAVSNGWTVYMGHSANNSFATSSSWETGLTQVFTGTVDCPAVPGWVTIPLDAPFTYDGMSNLVVGVYENVPGYDYPYGQFHNTSDPSVRGMIFYSDGTNPDPLAPPPANGFYNYFPNILMQIGDAPVGPPGPPMLSYPADGATGLPVGGFNFAWGPDVSGGLPDEYTLFVSDTDDPTDFWNTSYIYYGLTSTSYNPATHPGNPIPYAYDDRWYWTVQAINSDGDAVQWPPRMFDIQSDPTQPLPYSQSFDVATWPDLWTQQYSGGVTSNRWTVNSSAVAGGSPYEMMNSWASGTGISRLVSPPINTGGVSIIAVNFKHFFDDYGVGETVKLQYSHDLTNWFDTPWSFASGAGDVSGPVAVTIPGLSAPMTYVGWTIDGNHYQHDYWYVDDVIISEPLDHDVAPLGTNLPEVVNSSSVINPIVTVINNGLNTETFDVQLDFGPDYIQTQTVTGLLPGETTPVPFPPFTPGFNAIYPVNVSTLLPTDMNPANDDFSSVMISIPLDVTAYADAAYDPTGTYSGPFSFNLQSPGTITDLPDPNPWAGSFLAGADWVDGDWLGSVYSPIGWWQVDPTSGAGTLLGNPGAVMSGVAYDEENGILYGTDAYSLYTIDPATGAQTLVGSHLAGGGAWGGVMIGLAYDSFFDVLYGVDLGYDALFSINTMTGEATAIGNLGIDLNYAQDLAIDRNTGYLYLAGYTGAGALYWIYQANGSAWKIGDFPNGAEVTGFAIPYAGMAMPEVSIAPDGTLSWPAVPGATGYNVWGSTDPYGTFTYMGSTTATSWLDPNFPDPMYYYQVTASDTVIRAGRAPLQGVENIPSKTHRANSGPASSNVVPRTK